MVRLEYTISYLAQKDHLSQPTKNNYTHNKNETIRLTIMKYVATSRNPGGPKARHVNVPSKKAAATPGRESPVARIGEPATKMRKLLRRADFHVAGDDWIRAMASETAP